MSDWRSKAREHSLKVLYQMDVTKDVPEEGLRIFFRSQIGRASCRERVCQYV